jgi:ACDE family multidrug resistance protein
MVLSNSMLIPLLPAMQREMGLDPLQVGLVITAFSLPAGAVIPLSGFLADRWGRKLVLVPALLLFGLGGLLAGVAASLPHPSFPGLIAARLLQGLGGGGTYQIAMALAGDLSPPDKRPKHLGLLESSNGLGKVAAPILGSALAMAVWWLPFFLYPLLAWLSALAVALAVPEPGKSKEAPLPYLRHSLQLLRENAPEISAVFAGGMICLFTLFGALTHFTDVLESRFRVGGLAKGFVIALPVLALALTSYLGGKELGSRLRELARPVSTVGMLLLALGLGMAAWRAGSFFWLTGALTAAGAGTGLALATYSGVITGLSGTEQRGLLTALYGTVRFLGAALGPPLAGKAGGTTFLLLALLSLAGVGLSHFLLGHHRTSAPAIRR